MIRKKRRVPLIDTKTALDIVRYHASEESAEHEPQRPRIGPREVADEVERDIWTAIQQGVI